jgi:biotin operon repressor
MASHWYPQLNDREWLTEHYVTQRQSTEQIARELGCHATAVRRALKRLGIKIERRGATKYHQLQDREWLEERIKTQTIRQIAEEVGCKNHATVFAATRRLGISIPDRAYQISPEGRRAREEGYRKRYPNGRFGPDAVRWKGGRRVAAGYVYLYAPDHPRAGKRGTVQEHILVMERRLGRYLEPGEIVHHRNHVKDDNRPENLYLTKNGVHISEHFAEGKRAFEAEAENERLRKLLAASEVENAILKATIDRVLETP